MSYEGQGAEDERLDYQPDAQEWAPRGYYLWWGSLTMNIATGSLPADEADSVPYSGTDIPAGDTLILGPVLVEFLEAETRTGTHPVQVEYQLVLDGANVGTPLVINAGTVSGSQVQNVPISAGWHLLRVEVTPSAPDATVARYGANVRVVEQGP